MLTPFVPDDMTDRFTNDNTMFHFQQELLALVNLTEAQVYQLARNRAIQTQYLAQLGNAGRVPPAAFNPALRLAVESDFEARLRARDEHALMLQKEQSLESANHP